MCDKYSGRALGALCCACPQTDRAAAAAAVAAATAAARVIITLAEGGCGCGYHTDDYFHFQ